MHDEIGAVRRWWAHANRQASLHTSDPPAAAAPGRDLLPCHGDRLHLEPMTALNAPIRNFDCRQT